MIKNIVFDSGGVIVHHTEDHDKKVLANFFTAPFERIEKIWQDNLHKLLEGNLTSRGFLEKVNEELRGDHNIEELHLLWSNSFNTLSHTIDYQIIDFIKTLQSKYNLYLLTNIIDIHSKHHSHQTVSKLFHKVFRSYEEKLKKPDKEAFLNLLNKTKSKVKETIFIDDSERNIKTAKDLGIKTILYKNIAQLKKELKRYGVA